MKLYIQQRDNIISMLVIVILKLLSLLPLKSLRLLGKYLGKFWVLTKNDYYLTAMKNFELCYPHETFVEHHIRSKKTLEHLGQTFFETAHAWIKPINSNSQYIECIYGENYLKEALTSNQAILFIVPHIGNWEWLNTYLPKFCKIDVLYKSLPLKYLNTYIAKKRKRCGIGIHASDGMGLRAYIRKFLSGGNVLILPDQEPSIKNGVFVNFFGVNALTPRIIHDLLIKQENATVIIAYAIRTEKGFSIHIEKPKKNIYSNGVVESTTALSKSIELIVEKYSDQYQWGYKRFRRQPGNQLNPYKKLKWNFKEKISMNK